VASKFREARDENGRLTYARGEDRLRLIEHLPVINVATGEQSRLRDWSGCSDSTPEAAAVSRVTGVHA
jgi:hypothetical protein